jgi:hypothetical protein
MTTLYALTVRCVTRIPAGELNLDVGTTHTFLFDSESERQIAIDVARLNKWDHSVSTTSVFNSNEALQRIARSLEATDAYFNNKPNVVAVPVAAPAAPAEAIKLSDIPSSRPTRNRRPSSIDFSKPAPNWLKHGPDEYWLAVFCQKMNTTQKVIQDLYANGLINIDTNGLKGKSLRYTVYKNDFLKLYADAKK